VEDAATISIAHAEMIAETQEILYVYDLTLVISPFKGDINLDAIKFFIEDCVKKGNMIFLEGSFDQYQSSSSRQYLERELGIKVSRISVDSTLDPYKNFIADVKAGRVSVGRNIYIKNNLKSLILTPRKNSKTFKVDHTVGEKSDPEGDINWETSLIGLHAKDCTDSMAAAMELLKRQGAPIHFHNNFAELSSLDGLLSEDSSFYDYLSKRDKLSEVVSF
jgi:hypothetical protein